MEAQPVDELPSGAGCDSSVIRGQFFDELQLRLHPAASPLSHLAETQPGTFVAFDLLADRRGDSLLDLPLSKRRKALADASCRPPIFKSTRIQRRLAAIPAADVVGYSRLVEADEAGSLRSRWRGGTPFAPR